MSPESARPVHGGHVDARLPAVAELGASAAAAGSRCANALTTPSDVVAGVARRGPELAHRQVQRGGQRAAQRLVGPGLELAGAPAARAPPPSAAR